MKEMIIYRTELAFPEAQSLGHSIDNEIKDQGIVYRTELAFPEAKSPGNSIDNEIKDKGSSTGQRWPFLKPNHLVTAFIMKEMIIYRTELAFSEAKSPGHSIDNEIKDKGIVYRTEVAFPEAQSPGHSIYNEGNDYLQDRAGLL